MVSDFWTHNPHYDTGKCVMVVSYVGLSIAQSYTDSNGKRLLDPQSTLYHRQVCYYLTCV